MFSSNPDKWFLAFVAALALSGVACSPASMFARAAAANRERYGYGTAASPGGVPSWAIHVARPKLDGGATLDTLEARLIRELTEDKILEVFVSPEQLGAVAVRELQKGHPFDAAALLALASYRRFQQAEAAYDYGLTDGLRVARERVGYGRTLNEETYRQYVEEEARAFRKANFDDELERVGAKLGLSLDGRSIDDDLMRLVMGHINDPDAANRVFKERAAVMTVPTPEKVFHPGFVSAVHHYFLGLTRLEEGDNDFSRASVACGYLARVPLRAFRFSALQAVVRPFDGLVVRAGVRLYAQEPARVAELLRSVRGETRAHVAIVLGLSGDITRIRELQDSYVTEPDPRVRLAIEFALLRLGESRYLAALQAGLRDSDTRLVEYATILTHWLPYDLELEFSEESLSEVVTNKALPVGLRFVAVLIFLEIGAKRPLSEQTLQLLLNFVREIRDKPEPLELFARGFAKLEQLDRARVLVELRKSNALVEPWLERFAKLALPADLVLLDKLFRSGAYTTPHLHVARVAAAIPGADAQTTLQRWFADYPRLRTSILFLLILRPDVDKPRLHHLLSRIGGAHEFTFALASGEASLRAAARYTSGSNIEERQEVMLALRFFGSTLYRKMLWPSASYYDDRSYPAEVRVRQLALTALIDLELNRSDRPVAAQPAAEGLALEMTSELIDERGSFPLPQLPEPSGELHLRAPAEVRGDPLSIEAIRAGALRGNHARLTPPSLAR